MEIYQSEIDHPDDDSCPLNFLTNLFSPVQSQNPVEISQEEQSLNFDSYAVAPPNIQACYKESPAASTVQQAIPQGSGCHVGRWAAGSHDLFNVLDPMYFPLESMAQGNVLPMDVFESQDWAGTTGDMG
jgi:hypothetical protein